MRERNVAENFWTYVCRLAVLAYNAIMHSAAAREAQQDQSTCRAGYSPDNCTNPAAHGGESTLASRYFPRYISDWACGNAVSNRTWIRPDRAGSNWRCTTLLRIVTRKTNRRPVLTVNWGGVWQVKALQIRKKSRIALNQKMKANYTLTRFANIFLHEILTLLTIPMKFGI